MTLEELAKFFALLTILEPEADTCVQARRLAVAGTATSEETDTGVVKELRSYAESIKSELDSVSSDKLERKTKLVAKFLA
ncbi:hypothetical protein [Streptomyces noursei]|uniref:hypothetical protein n=1 Tax=Streptomyces noursei TaxID=1971 RepID=UPI001674E558|nr:hypothetical protein [Streptomyces noursei]MCZ1021118.1 hypothetical protein [Streptomyces noursei]MCZ1021309.1 hypothetical protein [Streptomyces noursei]GGX58325.1 hypothetical protein GCM10010341_92160 [Streptomyces noursei]